MISVSSYEKLPFKLIFEPIVSKFSQNFYKKSKWAIRYEKRTNEDWVGERLVFVCSDMNAEVI